ncbi:MAG: PulJ/GspJ family protein, partial [Polymorphobacter sp.]
MTRRAAGFTLLEMLVSLALMGMAAGLLVAALGTGRNLAVRSANAADATEAVVAAQMLLRTRIEAMRAEARFDASAPYADVRGDAFRLSFTAPAADALRPAPEQRYRLLLQQGALMLYHVDPLRRGINTDDPSLRGWSAAPLLGGVRDFDIAYFGVGPPDNSRRWRQFWQDRPRL